MEIILFFFSIPLPALISAKIIELKEREDYMNCENYKWSNVNKSCYSKYSKEEIDKIRRSIKIFENLMIVSIIFIFGFIIWVKGA